MAIRKRGRVHCDEFGSADDHSRVIRESGVPSLEDVANGGRGVGYHADLHNAIWGTRDFGDTVADELRDEQRRSPHKFVCPRCGGRPSRRPRRR